MKTSFYTGKIEDESAIYFDADHFNISSDGIVDVSDELQKAVNMVVEEYGYGIVFVPEGKYLLSKTIYIPKAVRIIGYGEKRPEFILKDNALNFNISKEDDKGHFRYLFWFVDRVVTEGTNVNANDANPGTFYSAMSNVNINLGRENDYAVAFRTHYAQHAFLAHITINVNSGMAGIYDVGNEMEDIEIVGGNYGIITTKCSPGWPFVMVDTKFENQKKAAIFTREAGLTIVRTDVKNVPQFVEVQDGFFEKLYIEDSIFKNVDKLLNIALENNSLTSIYVKNCYLEKCNVIVSYKDTENTIDNKYDCAHINEYIHGITASDEYPEKQIKDILYIGEKQIDYNVLYTDLKTLPEVKQWINVKKNGLIGDGVTDDTKVLKELIEKYTYLYFPQGEYLLTDTIKLKDDTVIIGLNPVSTKFILKDNAERFTGYGKGIAFIESGKSNILFGIGIETGGKNPRAIGLKWNGDIDSYINDVKMFGVILIVLFAYVISVFTVHSIEKESSIIGTLYALGVARRELMRHYLMLPVVVTTLAGILGFLAAVSPVGIPVQMQDCLAYFSMPEITVQVPVYLILYGVFMPPVMACVVNYIVIRKKLSRTALSLIRNETKKKKQKAVQLGKMSFLKMFRIRQMLRESRAGITVAVGMFIALLCMMISLDCYELCVHVRDNNIADTNYDYMYTLKYPEKEVPDGGSPALAKTMKKQIYGYNWDVMVLGIEKGNSYFDANVEKGKGKVVASSALAQKYELSIGDEFTLKDEETDTLYAFEVTDICQYAPAFYVFMDIDSARDLFGEQDDYYNTIFSNKDLKIPSGRLYATTTKEDIEKSADVFMQMMVSMVITITIVSTLIFILVMYLMMKVMIDRSAYSISLMKVFGFRTREIRKLYLDGNFYIVLVSAIVNIPLSKAIMDWMYPRYLVSNIACGLDLSFEPWLYVAVFALIMICYFVINRVLVGRLKKMTPAEVLKNRE